MFRRDGRRTSQQDESRYGCVIVLFVEVVVIVGCESIALPPCRCRLNRIGVREKER